MAKRKYSASRIAGRFYNDWRSKPYLKSMGKGQLPILKWFEHGNEAGMLVGLFIFFLIVEYWASGLPTDPFTAYPEWITLWTGFYTNTKWILTLALPFFGFAIAYHIIEEGAGKNLAHGGGVVGVNSVAGLTKRIQEARARIGQKKPEGPKLNLGKIIATEGEKKE